MLDNRTQEFLTDQFHIKNEYLEKHTKSELTPETYFEYIFQKKSFKDNPLNVFIHSKKTGKSKRKAKGKILKFSDMDELYKIFWSYKNLSIPMIEYHNSNPFQRSTKNIYAYVVDIDDVDLKTLKRILKKLKNKKLKLLPNLISSSGNGIHLYWVFDEPIFYFHQICDQINAALRKIQRDVSKHLKKADEKTSAFTSFRPAGARTKFGSKVRTFFLRKKKYSFFEICEAYNITIPPVYNFVYAKEMGNVVDMEKWREKIKEFKREKEKEGTSEPVKEKFNVKDLKPNAREGFFNHSYDRAFDEVPEGNRNNALFALGVIARKCGMSADYVKRQLKELVDFWNSRDKKILHHYEVDQTVNSAYRHDEYLRTRAFKLEKFLGFSFLRSTKRRPAGERLKREQHLVYMRYKFLQYAKELRNEKLNRIAEYLYQFGYTSQNAIAKALNMSKSTVNKYLKMIDPNVNVKVAA